MYRIGDEFLRIKVLLINIKGGNFFLLVKNLDFTLVFLKVFYINSTIDIDSGSVESHNFLY